jgi:hypothetical protein
MNRNNEIVQPKSGAATRRERTEHAIARKITWFILPAVVIFYLLLTVLALMRPDMLLVADVHTEQISFDVIDREKAAFSFEASEWRSAANPEAAKKGW